MSPGNAAHRGKAEASSSRSRGEEGIEDASKIFFTDASAIIRDFDYSFVFSFLRAMVLRSLDPYFDLTIAIYRLNCIDDQVQHGIFNLRRVDGNCYWVGRRIEFKPDAMTTRNCIRQ